MPMLKFRHIETDSMGEFAYYIREYGFNYFNINCKRTGMGFAYKKPLVGEIKNENRVNNRIATDLLKEYHKEGRR